jgi:LIVCS family branched-chain amino acid:cation transporter
MSVTLLFGLFDGLNAAGLQAWVPAFCSHLPLAEQSLGWLLPVGLTLVLAASFDRLRGAAFVEAE